MKHTLISSLLCLCSLAAIQHNALAQSDARGANAPLSTIETLDVARYMGTWFEIAKFPNWFQKKCTGNTKAEYSLKADGKVQVINRCRLEDGASSVAIGAARQLGARSSAKLEVRFAPEWMAFLPAVWGDYWVIDLDERYQLVAVSEPKRKYLWILSRTPHIDQKAYDALLGRLTQKGFDIRQLDVTKQD